MELSARVEVSTKSLDPSNTPEPLTTQTKLKFLAVTNFVAVPAFQDMLPVIGELKVFIPVIVWFQLVLTVGRLIFAHPLKLTPLIVRAV
jgi:hypothetical protein